MWVYSAYYENRSSYGIQVIGALAFVSNERLQCVIWDDSDATKEVPQALLVDAEIMVEEHSTLLDRRPILTNVLGDTTDQY